MSSKEGYSVGWKPVHAEYGNIFSQLSMKLSFLSLESELDV